MTWSSLLLRSALGGAVVAAALTGAYALGSEFAPDDPDVDDTVDISPVAGGPCGFLRHHPLLSDFLYYTDQIFPSSRGISHLRATCTAIDTFLECDQGNDRCAAQGVVNGLCEYYLAVNPTPLTQTHPFLVFARHFEEVVGRNGAPAWMACVPPLDPPAGQSSLHCCKYDESDTHCHSGFAPPSINCGISYGNADLNAVGTPTCAYIPECSQSGGDPQGREEPPTLDEMFRELEGRYLSAVRRAGADPDDPRLPGGEPSECGPEELFNLGTFRGCRGFTELLDEARLFHGDAATWVVSPESAGGYTNSALAMGVMANNAAMRIVLGMPKGPDRMAFVNARSVQNLGPGTPQDHMASHASMLGLEDLNPEEELLKWLSPCSLELLKRAYPTWWPLLGYPTYTVLVEGRDVIYTPNEDTHLDHTLYEDACVVGEAPSITHVAVQPVPSGVEHPYLLEVTIEDPEREHGFTRYSEWLHQTSMDPDDAFWPTSMEHELDPVSHYSVPFWEIPLESMTQPGELKIPDVAAINCSTSAETSPC